jgi:hypothetical protein
MEPEDLLLCLQKTTTNPNLSQFNPDTPLKNSSLKISYSLCLGPFRLPGTILYDLPTSYKPSPPLSLHSLIFKTY